MFGSCMATILDLSSFNTSRVENMNWMFMGCGNVTTIYAGAGWVTASSAEEMFESCDSLVGQNGTEFDGPSPDYARIDTSSTPGYFTAKT